jgi:hypothetical protein
VAEEFETDLSDPSHRVDGARLLARSFYKELRSSGYSPKELLELASELIAQMTLELQQQREGPGRVA